MVRRALKLLFWRTLALVSVGLGLLGVVLPGLPTVPFLLLAAWAASRGWPALERWLLEHPRHGPTVRQWRERGAVPRRAKWLSSVMMAASATIMWIIGVPLWALALAVVTMTAVAVWMWRRPEA
ncbi:MAG: YbaN family protein [Rubrivivax sp.]|nr:YbaN family protein [Rubrivivax sp.]